MKACRECPSTDMATRSALCKAHHRLYLKQHYANNKQYYVDKAQKRTLEIKEILREKKAVPCKDCGVQYPYYVMDFDHLYDKSFTVSKLPGAGNVKKLLDEIAKCEVVCSNCHRERTWSRANP